MGGGGRVEGRERKAEKAEFLGDSLWEWVKRFLLKILAGGDLNGVSAVLVW